MRALISVSDKTGVVDFAKNLQKYGVEIISTGGTADLLEKEQIPVVKVQDVTGFPECLDGRVKTLHPRIHAGLLARRDNPEHMNTLKEMDITPIDLVVVNLYPFKQTILKEGVTREEAIENIDIGGPSMLRAAAKNYQDVAVVVDPGDYEGVIKEIAAGGGFCPQTKLYLAAKVFQHTAHYDSLIANYLHKEGGLPLFGDTVTFTYEKVQEMRYGENPHQMAAFYKEVGRDKSGIGAAKQLHGKELSFNNINDANGALELLKEFEEPTVVASKHANPCGVGSGQNIYEAYKKAYESDPVSVFGGIIAANGEIDEKTARMMSEIFLEIIVAPSFSEEALAVLTQKKNIRLMVLPEISQKPLETELDIKKVLGGILVQQKDLVLVPETPYKIVTERKPTEQELKDLLFTWKIVKHVKSNGIAIGKNGQSIGVGPGQVNRIWACEQAIDHGMHHLGKEFLQGAALASDAYFPFPDCAEAAAKAGITAIIQPGGSIRDELSIKACNAHNIAMVFTDMRHFKH